MRQFDELLTRMQLAVKRSDLRAGIIASTIANVFRSKGKASKPQDFMPQESSQPNQPKKDLLATVEMLNAALGGEDKRESGNSETTC